LYVRLKWIAGRVALTLAGTLSTSIPELAVVVGAVG
jgi:hypothetical protein